MSRSSADAAAADQAFRWPDDPLVDLKRRQRMAAYGARVTPVIPRPVHGAECTRCGMCCVVRRCFVGRGVFGDDGAERPALEWSLDGASCGIMANPRRYLPTRVQIEGATRVTRGGENTRGAPDQLVLVIDFTSIDSQDSINQMFKFWQTKIIQDHNLWRSGFSLQRIRLAVRDFADDYGADILKAVKLVESSH